MSVPISLAEYNTYFSCTKDNISVLNLAKISIKSGYLTVMDYSNADYAGGEYTPFYTEFIEPGEYNVQASVLNCGKGGYRVAAAKIEFSREEPYEFKMAVYENQDITQLKEGCFYGFDIDTGLAIISDAEVLNEYCMILEEYDENEDVICPAIEYYSAYIEKELKFSHEKFPEHKIDYIDYVIPETEHHMLFLPTGNGDGTYPVYFGYSKAGNLCCAVVQFIFDI